MKTSQLSICDCDERYLDKLSDYISRKDMSPFIVKTYSNMSKLLEAESPHGILLVSSLVMCDDISLLEVSETIILDEGNLSNNYIGFPVIFKYQSAEEIFNYLLDFYYEKEGGLPYKNNSKTKSEFQIIGVYSPIGRIGKSGYAKQLATEFSQQFKVIYISFEAFSLLESAKENLSDIIYYYKQNQTGFIRRLEEVVWEKDGVDYLSPATSVIDIRSLELAEWKDFFEQLNVYSKYEKVIIDFGSLPYEIGLFGVCRNIYVPFIPEPEQLTKLNKFEQFLTLMELEEVVEKLIKIELKTQ